MRHARAEALDTLETLLARVRGFDALIETSRGVFYLRRRAFLHFHEDPTGLFADARIARGGEFERLKVDDKAGADQLVGRIEAFLAGGQVAAAAASEATRLS